MTLAPDVPRGYADADDDMQVLVFTIVANDAISLLRATGYHIPPKLALRWLAGYGTRLRYVASGRNAPEIDASPDDPLDYRLFAGMVWVETGRRDRLDESRLCRLLARDLVRQSKGAGIDWQILHDWMKRYGYTLKPRFGQKRDKRGQ
ncbi:hypothetical protein [Bifidobacterium myosotis]|uniref:Uncharacterized protein n=1 Tax=Bifidobacterium myosotis TaxID=1630166 RepID=A0A5M9ZHA5_9BIFI|nr:hypothetical protein [Bifidobacterium myosotis]KAA8826940.1 hypothetical protein EMO91_10440 [Bifidobacterium myosotis]